MQSDFSCTPQGTDAHHAPQGQHHNPHWPKGSGQKHHASAIDGKSPKELLGLMPHYINQASKEAKDADQKGCSRQPSEPNRKLCNGGVSCK